MAPGLTAESGRTDHFEFEVGREIPKRDRRMFAEIHRAKPPDFLLPNRAKITVRFGLGPLPRTRAQLQHGRGSDASSSAPL